MLKLPHNHTHLTCLQSNVQNSPRQASTVHKPWTFRCSSWILKRQGNQISNFQHLMDHQKSERSPEKHLFLLYWLCQKLWHVDHNKLWKILKEMGIPDHLTCLLTNIYEGQEATIRTRHGTTSGSKSGKEYIKAVYCHSAYLTYMHITSCEMLGWMKHKVESRLLQQISITLDLQITPHLWPKVKKN